jgi:hypothetical protein
MDRFSPEELQADEAAYAALKTELSEPDPDIPEGLWSSDFLAGETVSEPAPQGSGAPAGGGPDDDAERQQRIAEAAAIAQDYLQNPGRYQQAPAHHVPDVYQDPIAHFDARLQAYEAQQAQQQFASVVAQSEALIRQSRPDYDAACQHLEEARMRELEMAIPDDDPRSWLMARQLGLQNPAQLRTVQLQQDAIGVARIAVARGQSPAEFYYNLAMQRGWRSGHQAIETARRGQASVPGRERAAPIKGKFTLGKLADLYAEDPEQFDVEWERARKAGALG